MVSSGGIQPHLQHQMLPGKKKKTGAAKSGKKKGGVGGGVGAVKTNNFMGMD